jgi:aldehyde:ferredoxin oxidoreductase
LFEARLWAQRQYGNDLYNPEETYASKTHWTWFGVAGTDQILMPKGGNARLHACPGCHRGCHERAENPLKNDSMCTETAQYYYSTQEEQESGDAYIIVGLLQKLGINASEISKGRPYLEALANIGVLGPGREIDCEVPSRTVAFFQNLYNLIVTRQGIGDDIAEGFYRAAERWGRLEEDLRSGILNFAYWGQPTHSYDPRAEVSWGYGSILGDRDINEHCFQTIFWKNFMTKGNPPLGAEEVVKIITGKMAPFEDDPQMLNASDENIYSEHTAKLVAWHRYYTRFWKESILYCDNRWPDLINTKGPGNAGMTGEGEQKFFNAVTGKDISFLDGIGVGKRIWNLDNAIWTLQGRHRDMVHFSEFIYREPFIGDGPPANYYLPWFEDGQWTYRKVNGRYLDREKFEEFKTLYYELEGWDVETGWPKRRTLEELNLAFAADELEEKGKLGAG